MELEAIGRAELDDFAAVLMEAELVADDLAEPDRVFYRLALAPGVFAYAGLERYGADALLRSVVSPRRGGGLAVVEAVVAVARSAGVERLWLLTESAGAFFAKLGFADVDRGAAPAVIAATRQFAGLCPASARLMLLDTEGA